MRFMKLSMSTDGNARADESAEMPIDSLKSIAGSSESRLRTVSIFVELSHLGISDILWVHFSGQSDLRHSSHTSVILIVSNRGFPIESVSANILL